MSFPLLNCLASPLRKRLPILQDPNQLLPSLRSRLRALQAESTTMSSFLPYCFFFYFPPFSNYGDYPVARFLVFASVTSTVSTSEGRNSMCRVLRPRCLSLHQAHGRCTANIWCFFFFFQMGLITNARPCPRGCRWCCGVRRKGVGQLSTFKCLCYAECSKGRPPSAKLRHLYTWLPSSLGLTSASWQVGGTWRAARWWWEGEVPSALAHHSLSTAESHGHTPSCKRG